MELVLGAGHRSGLRKVITTDGDYEYKNAVTVDINPEVKPDVVHDLNSLPLPFGSEEFDEIHAYEVLEHLGRQGDYEGFFREFGEYWRVLKPGGYLVGSCPKWDSIWAWGDPSHTRVLSNATFVFLDQDQYKAQEGKTPMTDFRYLWNKSFQLVFSDVQGDQWFFILEKKV